MCPVSRPTSTKAFATYEATAPFYDHLTAHHDYELWLGNLLPLLNRHGLVEGELLDIACGTGKSFLPMVKWGWKVTGVDGSPAMLRRAVAKAPAEVRLEVSDMRELPVLGRFDLVWCLDDAVNCLDDEEDLRQTFAGFARNLSATGLLLFDVNTLLTYRGFFTASEVVELADGTTLEWHGLTDPGAESDCVARAQFHVHDADGSQLVSVLHQQRHFDLATVSDALEDAGLELVDLQGQSTDAVLQPLDESRHTKAIFVARLKEGR